MQSMQRNPEAIQSVTQQRLAEEARHSEQGTVCGELDRGEEMQGSRQAVLGGSAAHGTCSRHGSVIGQAERPAPGPRGFS
jgi:hypothetical protein